MALLTDRQFAAQEMAMVCDDQLVPSSLLTAAAAARLDACKG